MTRARLIRAVAACATAGAVVLGASACSSDPNSVANQAKSGDRKGYISGDGRIAAFPAADRKDPVDLHGTTLDGKTWSAADHRGDVIVVNLWASWCGPCAKEAPDLVATHQKFAKDKAPVTFIGIDYREPSVETGRAQAKAWGFTYPSLFDASGETALMLDGKMTTQPSTAVLDTQGRIAAVVLGVVDHSTLTGLVEDTLAESA